MNQKFIFILSLIFIFSCGNEPAPEIVNQKNSTTAFNQMLDEYYDAGSKLNPMYATTVGENNYNHLFPNLLSDEHQQNLKNYYTSYLKRLKEYPEAELSESAQISKAVLKWDCEINLERLTFPEDIFPINQKKSPHLMIGQMATGTSSQPFKTVKDYNNWLQRLDGYLDWMATAESKMKEGIETKQVLPKALIVKVLPQLEAFTTEKIEDNLFYQPIKNFPESFTSEEKATLTESYTKIITNRLIPAYRSLHHFMSNEYMAAGRTSSGIGTLSNGKEYYDHRIKIYTTTYMKADEIHQLGLSEVTRILSEMEKVKKEVDFQGDLRSFFDHVRDNKALMPFKNPQEVIDNFNAIHDRMKPQIAKLFDVKIKTPFEVRRVEAFREKTIGPHYAPGSLDGTNPGVFYVPVPDVTKYNTFWDESLFLHEAIPGHHYQNSVVMEDPDLPKFRKILWYSGYGEGWALYCESLGKELGLYTDPYQYFGMLSAEMHRAIRLVVDTGIHTKGWTREKAIQYSLDHEAEPEARIISEIERYMANPGQALSYKIGQLKIIALRDKAEKDLGEKFDIQEFHNQILATGCVPLAVLENKINNWITANK